MLEVISWLALVAGFDSSLIIIADLIKHPQHMAIMNIVWPLNRWFLGPIALLTYYKWGRIMAKNLKIEDRRGEAAMVTRLASQLLC